MSFPRYPKYRDSGVASLGEVPEHWDVKRLKYTCHVFPSSVDKKSLEGETPVRLCNYTDVYYNERITPAIDFMTATALSSQIAKFTLRADDTVVTKDSETPYDIAVAAYVPVALPGVVCGYHLAMVRPLQCVSGAFVKRLFDSVYAKSLFATLANGLTRFGLGQYALDNAAFPFPPQDEQTSIAGFLNRETAKIDALVAEQRRLCDLLREKVFSLALSSAHLLEGRTMRLRDAATIVSRPVVQRAGDLYTPVGLLNWGRGLFHKDARGIDEMGDSDFFWIEDGDFIISGQFAWEGAVALAGPSDAGCVASHRYHILRGRSGISLTEYLLALFSTTHGAFLLNEHSRGAAGRNRPLNIDSLMKEYIPVPDMRIQERVAEAVHSKNSAFRESSVAIDLLQERRTALISAAVTGKIDVRGLADTKAA